MTRKAKCPAATTRFQSVTTRAMTGRPLALADRRILLPVSISPLDAAGKLYNPAGAYTYHDSAALIGRWRGGKKLEWEMGDPIQGDPVRATRGMDEPTVAQLADGRILMVMRGSNDKRPELPSYRWHSFSSDGGRRWTKPARLAFATASRRMARPMPARRNDAQFERRLAGLVNARERGVLRGGLKGIEREELLLHAVHFLRTRCAAAGPLAALYCGNTNCTACACGSSMRL